jgi:hypothetical protein
VHALDDVAALAELAQRHLSLIVDHPLPRSDFTGEAEGCEFAQAAHLLDGVGVGLAAGLRRDIDDAGLCSVADKLPIELRPALRLDLAFERAANIEIGARAKLLCDEVARDRACPP